MQITSSSNIVAMQDAAVKSATPQPPASPAAPAEATPGMSRADDLASLEIAREALRRAAPEYDPGRVAQIRSALRSGAIPFDASRLAAAMLSAHRGNG